MFSQTSVILSIGAGVHGEGEVCVVKMGVCGKGGHVWQRESMAAGCAWQKRVACIAGAHMAWVCAWQEACMAGA